MQNEKEFLLSQQFSADHRIGMKNRTIHEHLETAKGHRAQVLVNPPTNRNVTGLKVRRIVPKGSSQRRSLSAQEISETKVFKRA